MPIEMGDLKGEAKAMAQKLMNMDSLERMSVLEVVNELTYHYRVPDLAPFSGLLWSRGKVESILLEFFTASIWNMERQRKASSKKDGSRDWTWTNMTMDAQITCPLQFDREEIRIYCEHPDDDERLKRIITPLSTEGYGSLGGVTDHFGQSVHTKLDGGVEVRHIPLPEPTHPYDLERAQDLLAIVNGRKLPCASWMVPRKIHATECFLLEVATPGEPESFKGLGLIAVYLGTLYAPKDDSNFR